MVGTLTESIRPRQGGVAALALVLAAAGCATTTLTTTGDWHYAIATDGATQLEAEVCFDGHPPDALVPGLGAAAAALRGARTHRGEPLATSGGRIRTAELGAGACVTYDLDVAALGALSGHAAARLPDALVAAPDTWLWRPEELPATGSATASFATPPGRSVSTPWPRMADGRFQVPRSAFGWQSRLAFGALTHLEVTRPDTRLDIAVVGETRLAGDDGLRRWLGAALDTVAELGAPLPVERVQVVVVAVPGADRPVLFGMALRGGGPALVLLLNAFARDDALVGEWVAVHELFHLGLPYVASADAWLGEGVTTWYQEILRARAGHLSAAQAWQRLHDGFGRGRAVGGEHTLREETRRMHRHRTYHRVYWGGAAIAMAWDLALRRATDNERSLDDAVLHLRACCMGRLRRWSADEILAELDAWWGAPLFSRIASETLEQQRFPAVEADYQALGLAVDGTSLALDPDAPEAELCRDIMAQTRSSGR